MVVGCKVLKSGVSVDFQDEFPFGKNIHLGDLAENPTIHQQLTTGS